MEIKKWTPALQSEAKMVLFGHQLDIDREYNAPRAQDPPNVGENFVRVVDFGVHAIREIECLQFELSAARARISELEKMLCPDND